MQHCSLASKSRSELYAGKYGMAVAHWHSVFSSIMSCVSSFELRSRASPQGSRGAGPAGPMSQSRCLFYIGQACSMHCLCGQVSCVRSGSSRLDGMYHNREDGFSLSPESLATRRERVPGQQPRGSPRPAGFDREVRCSSPSPSASQVKNQEGP